MTDLFEEEMLEEDSLVESNETIDLEMSENATLDARRRLEKKLEEKRLQDELEDFDY